MFGIPLTLEYYLNYQNIGHFQFIRNYLINQLNMDIYKNKVVSDLQAFYGDLLYPKNGTTIVGYLEQIGERLWEGIQANNPIVGVEFSNYNPFYLGKKLPDIPLSNLTKKDAYLTIACEYGFDDWEQVKTLGEDLLNLDFENAVNLLLAGNIEELKKSLEAHPELTGHRSQFGHRATLLHYTGSNGVEAWRQVVPLNLIQVTKYLLEMGVDKHAKMKVYGGEFDTLALLASSGHPYEAGVGRDMEQLLLN